MRADVVSTTHIDQREPVRMPPSIFTHLESVSHPIVRCEHDRGFGVSSCRRHIRCRLAPAAKRRSGGRVRLRYTREGPSGRTETALTTCAARERCADPVAALAGRDDSAALAAMSAAGRAALRGGITTVRDLGDRDYLSLGLRGARDLPTIVAAGPPITTPAGHCHFLGGATEPTPQALRAAVRERADRGVDIIKVMASGGTMTRVPARRHPSSLPSCCG